MALETERPGFKSGLYHLLTVRLWEVCVTSLCNSFLVCKLQIHKSIFVPTALKIWWGRGFGQRGCRTLSSPPCQVTALSETVPTRPPSQVLEGSPYRPSPLSPHSLRGAANIQLASL